MAKETMVSRQKDFLEQVQKLFYLIGVINLPQIPQTLFQKDF